jgi:SAM-dependent methyltransferase
VSAERACELCGSTSHTRLYEVNAVPVLKCDNCGLVFAGESSTPEELVELYDSGYYEDPDDVGYAGYAAAEERKRHHDRTLLAQIEELVEPGRLLEIGCAYGYFLDEARKRGWEVRGVEPSEHAAGEARSRFGLDVAGEPFTELAAEPGSLDAIVLWDVIEHLPNPRETLAQAFVWLRPGGILGLSTGDIGSLTARLHGPHWSLMTPPWHQFYFSRKTLRRMLGDVGFDVTKITGDGNVAADPGSANQRVPGPVAAVLAHPVVVRAARAVGAGSIMFAYACKPGGRTA